jgi:hypothetical protein
MDFQATELSTGEVVGVDYDLTVLRTANSMEIGLAGEFTHPDHGYVTIQTPTKFMFYDGNDFASSGTMTIYGTDNTKARLTAINNQSCECEVDTNGDGVYEWTSGTVPWSYIEDGQDGAPTPGNWSGTADFGTIGFTVTADGTGISQIIISFVGYECGIVTDNSSITRNYTSPLAINNGQFSAQLGSGTDNTFTISGTFNSNQAASGTFTADYQANDTVCTGVWNASPGGDSSDDNGANQYSIDYVQITYRRYETGADRYQGWITLTDNSGPIQESDVQSIVMRNSEGIEQLETAGDFVQMRYITYDCMTGACSQSGPIEDSGFWSRYESLSPDTYTLEAVMENGQTLSATQTFAGTLELPYVSGNSMSSELSNGDLVLSWSNPDTEDNWSEVDQLRIVIFDNLGNDVLLVRLLPTDQTVTIPASLVAQAEVVNGGSALYSWQIQTRALDANGNNNARAYSNTMLMP